MNLFSVDYELKTCKNLILGGYDMEEKAARAYDLAALKYWGPTTHINFSVCIIFLPRVGLVFF